MGSDDQNYSAKHGGACNFIFFEIGELILADFKTKNEMIFDMLFTKWDPFKLKCLPLLQLKVKEHKGKLFLKELGGKSEDTQNVLLLLLLHSKYQKYLIDDSRNKFLIWKSTIGELQDYISGEVNS
ncbi:uncharacterized protein LOC119562579 isoform X2 [Drosophila subpulchrella]|uniref:uncharacterized protein LOC119562579 isoform X2 n=1 Tax=Drosophila subpulchrella TaxID=1486046 RepID=UPI0018A1A853|nr:uncharacterized protein LOC119562579 isoform X2 [Drosophila subpulchrella]